MVQSVRLYTSVLVQNTYYLTSTRRYYLVRGTTGDLVCLDRGLPKSPLEILPVYPSISPTRKCTLVFAGSLESSRDGWLPDDGPVSVMVSEDPTAVDPRWRGVAVFGHSVNLPHPLERVTRGLPGPCPVLQRLTGFLQSLTKTNNFNPEPLESHHLRRDMLEKNPQADGPPRSDFSTGLRKEEEFGHFIHSTLHSRVLSFQENVLVPSSIDVLVYLRPSYSDVWGLQMDSKQPVEVLFVSPFSRYF